MTHPSQYLFIDTAKCEGEPYKFSFSVPTNLIRCDKNQIMRLSLIKWTCRHDFTTVRNGNNAFTITYLSTPYTITIPDGNYTYLEYATKIQLLMNSIKASLGVSTGTIVVEYLAPSNHLKFTFPNVATRTFTFPGEFLGNYGMRYSDYTITNTVLESDAPINFYQDRERLYIYCEGIHPISTNRNLVHSSDITVNELEGQKNLLASVLINAYPFETIVYENDGTIYGHHIQSDHIFGNLNFVIKTNTGLEADFLPDSHLVLKIDKLPNEKMLSEQNKTIQEEIRDYLRLMFISQNIPSDLPTDAMEISPQ